MADSADIIVFAERTSSNFRKFCHKGRARERNLIYQAALQFHFVAAVIPGTNPFVTAVTPGMDSSPW